MRKKREKPGVFKAERFAVDHTLSPETAREQGYTWVSDVYDGEYPDTIYTGIIGMLTQGGNKLGQPKTKSTEKVTGMYAPLASRSIKKKKIP